MSGIFRRIGNIAKSEGMSFAKKVKDYLEFKEQIFNDTGRRSGYGKPGGSFTNEDAAACAGIPGQVVEDLATFNLTPPSCLEEVKTAWKNEIKKYHSDKFMNDPDKFETSKQIMQIYNTAYDRLKNYYENR